MRHKNTSHESAAAAVYLRDATNGLNLWGSILKAAAREMVCDNGLRFETTATATAM